MELSHHRPFRRWAASRNCPTRWPSPASRRPLFVTDPGLAKLPVVASTLKILDDAKVPYGVFSDVKPNPVESNLTAGIAVFKKGKHDGVIAFGGGSALDLGKLIAFQAGQTRPVWDFEDIGDWWTRADAGAIAPIVAVPTTAGTGSEVGRAGVLTNEATHTQEDHLPSEAAAGDRHCRSRADRRHAALHHRRHRAWTRWPTASKPIRAPGYHPMADGIAVEGMRLVFENLPKACRQRQGHHRPRQHDGAPPRWAPPPSRRASARSIRCRTRSARSTTPITA